MSIIALLGWVATTCFTACYLPQIFKTFKRKEVGDVSLWQWLIQLLGYSIGFVYGIALNQMPLIIGYACGWFCTVWFLFLYYKYRNNQMPKSRSLTKRERKSINQFFWSHFK
jgi:MtN3 and saliva related transmembrane protein